MSVARGVAVAAVLLSAAASAQSPSPSPTQAGVAVAAPPLVARMFTAPAGVIFNTVRPERVKDFETFLSHVKFALDTATAPAVQAQAKGWRFFKAGEPGPNNTVLYLFVLDPAIKDADYGLGRMLADAYPDTARLTEIWKLYTSSVTGGGTLLNLNPLMLEPPPPVTPPVVAAPGAAR